jgi:hypothetical protein
MLSCLSVCCRHVLMGCLDALFSSGSLKSLTLTHTLSHTFTYIRMRGAQHYGESECFLDGHIYTHRVEYNGEPGCFLDGRTPPGPSDTYCVQAGKAIHYLLSTACCLLSAVCCLLSAVCCLLSAVCCLLVCITYTDLIRLI